jgi:hypothetical protein
MEHCIVLEKDAREMEVFDSNQGVRTYFVFEDEAKAKVFYRTLSFVIEVSRSKFRFIKDVKRNLRDEKLEHNSDDMKSEWDIK